MINRNSDFRLKLLLAIIFTGFVLVLPVQQSGNLLILSAWLVFSVLLSRIDPLVLFGRILKVYPMIFLVTVFIPFSGRAGAQQSEFLFLRVSTEGLIRFAEMNIKFIMILICTTVFSMTTTPGQFVAGLKSLGLADWIVSIFFLMQRYIVILKGELQRQINAFRSRYIRLNWARRLGYSSKLLAMFMVRTFGRSERLYQTMLSRGFNGRLYINPEQRWTVRDSLVLGINLFYFGAMILIIWF